MQDFLGSVRRSLVFKPSAGAGDGAAGAGAFGGFVEKIGSSIRRSRIGLFSKMNEQNKGEEEEEDSSPGGIRWRRGELIGCGAFGRVYMGMNLDSGELLAVKQVSIANCASREKTQIHVKELEDEVKLLRNLTHPNIVRYLGTAREEDSLNILLEFVPGGSISSLLGKFGSFPESVIKMYTKQLLLGLQYLHKNGIMHRDIKGANILVDNKGCIKLADFGASKKVVELATMTGAKSMKGTPYWMAPEVILQTGHSFSADVWSVGCTIIEMATGKPPWSQQYQEVAALFHIGTTKSHPPIPEHLSEEAKDFLLKCLQKEPNLRPAASDLLQHPFVSGECQESNLLLKTSTMGTAGKQIATPEKELNDSRMQSNYLHGSVRCSTLSCDKFTGNSSLWRSSKCDDDMCQMDNMDDLMIGASEKYDSGLLPNDCIKSFNPISEPNDDWACKFEESPELKRSRLNIDDGPPTNEVNESHGASGSIKDDFTFPSGSSTAEDDDEITETKIRAFIDEKALELKKLQSPLYEEFYSSLNAAGSPTAMRTENKENFKVDVNLPPKSRSPKRLPSRQFSSAAIGLAHTAQSGTYSRRISHIGTEINKTSPEVKQSKPSEWKELLLNSKQEAISPRASFNERQRRWEEELYEELEKKREMMRQAGMVKTSPKDRIINRQKDKSRFASPGK